MENFTTSLSAVLPTSLMLGLGFLLMKIGMIQEQATATMRRLSFVVFIPFLLFVTIADSDISGVINLKLIEFAVIMTIAVFVILCIVIPLMERDPKRRGVLVQGILRSNFGIFGLPIAFALCKDGDIGSIPLMIALFVPLFSALSIVALELFRGGRIKIGKLIVAIFTNPLIIGAVLGLLFLLFKFKLPTPVMSAVNDVAGLATPLSLILLGASFRFKELGENKKQLAIGLIGKLIAVPLLVIPIAVLFGFRQTDLICLMIMFSAPAAVSTFTVASQFEVDAPLAGQLVVLGTIGSLFTIFAQIFILKIFDFI